MPQRTNDLTAAKTRGEQDALAHRKIDEDPHIVGLKPRPVGRSER
jgi:hypothetical protein